MVIQMGQRPCLHHDVSSQEMNAEKLFRKLSPNLIPLSREGFKCLSVMFCKENVEISYSL